METVMIHPWKYAVKPFKVVSNIYFVGTSYVSSYLIYTDKGMILLDTGMPQCTYLLIESIRQLGFDPMEIKYIVHTHSHYDHMGATRSIMELTGAASFMGREDIHNLYDRSNDLTWADEYGVEFHEEFEVDYPLEDGQIIKLGDTIIECVHSPGHTAGTFSFFINAQEDGQSYRCGIFGGPGTNTLSAKYLLKYNLPFSRRNDYMESLKRLSNEKVDIHIPSHPKFSGIFNRINDKITGRNKFSYQNEWPEFLAYCSKSLEKLIAQEKEQG